MNEVKEKDKQLAMKKLGQKEQETGLLLAKTGNIYDIPPEKPVHRRPHSVCADRATFERKEGGVKT